VTDIKIGEREGLNERELQVLEFEIKKRLNVR